MPGSLVLVATPIGNLEDITLRALRALREADLIAAEDTRRTGRLLAHYGITTPTTSLHEHNERSRVPALMSRIREGLRVALVTDAGMPAISDPGYLAVRTALDQGIKVDVVPGVSALTTAMSGSGLPLQEVRFLGFAPSRKAERRRWLGDSARTSRGTLVLYEAPTRLRGLLTDIFEVLGDRQVVVAHEMTKLHESWHRGWVRDLTSEEGAAALPVRGEFVILVSDQTREADTPVKDSETDVLAMFRELQIGNRMGRREAMTEVARHFGLPRRAVYSMVERHKVSVE